MSQENNEVIMNDEANEYTEENLNEHFNEFKKREHVYLACISSLEKEICQTHTYLNEWRSMHMYDDEDNKSSKDIININSLRNILIDPCINLEIKELRQKVYEITRKCNLAEEKLQGCNFDAQATAGQRLINKCKKLQEENYELGKTLEENNLQSLSIQILNLKQQIVFYKNELKILKELNADIDEDNELLSQQLAELTKKYTQVTEEKNELEKSNLKLNNYIDSLKSKLSKYNEISKDEQRHKKKNNYYYNSSENNANNEINNNEENQEEYKDEEEEYAEEMEDNDNEEDENYQKNEDFAERKEEEEEYTNENDSYKKKNSDESRDRKHRKLDKHYYKDKKYDKDKYKLREKEKEKNRKDRIREKEKTKERIKEKLKEREKTKNKYKNRNKEKIKSKTKKEQYDGNYLEQKRKFTKDHDNDFRETPRTDKFDNSNNVSKNDDMEDKTSECGSERERSCRKKERSKNKYKEKYKSRKRIKIRSNDEKEDDDAYDKKSNGRS
ncbi:conserved Plasmodium protein, unknown function [Plasmodium gallinaceum]|uniref:Pre-mRNA-splicing regulator n=1 Tax=Plasmodium gallinaceum TaxID=5849 RepID=A0A1J1GWM9_PLAGA|nr:conserved Plasmodium protein, unknown function [Plasmodium gallinaceum]CRG96945.1 conserved Plasmodium protein, unknown function [Plasmodium gallinaceum]